MTAPVNQPSVWSRLDQLSRPELARLVEAAVSVLQSRDPEAPGQAVTEWPKEALAAELKGLLAESVPVDQQAARQLTGDTPSSRPLALGLLHIIGQQPGLARDIETAYENRGQLLLVETGVIAAAALLFFVLKLRKFKAGKDGVEADFSSLSVDAIRTILKSIGLGV